MDDLKVDVEVSDESNKIFGIGINRLRELCNEFTCPYAVLNERNTVIIREKFQEYILDHRVI